MALEALLEHTLFCCQLRGEDLKPLTAWLLPICEEVTEKNGVFKACLDSVSLLCEHTVLGQVECKTNQ